MTEVPAFFLPGVAREQQEAAYCAIAQWCHEPVPPLDHRIYSITFEHNSEEWTATVG